MGFIGEYGEWLSIWFIGEYWQDGANAYEEYGEWASFGLIGKYGENSQDAANGRV